ncbi:MAG: hypothetical protein WCT09_03105 [Patescibacteria group bacterium]
MKNTKPIKANLIGLSALIFCLLPLLAKAQTDIDAAFNPNRILEDEEMLNYGSMGLPEIQNFLNNKGSYLANYSTLNTHGDTRSAAQIIYDATHNNYDCEGVTLSDTPTEAEKKAKCRQITTVNPKFLLVLLQKEASLVTDNSPAQSHLDWATGYGCPDSWVCNPYYKGFGKQVNSASLQFLAYLKEPERYSFKVGQTYIAKDKYGILKPIAKAINDGDYNTIMASPDHVSVTPENLATAALYNYTPHVFNGNYNTYKLWNTYFPKVSRLYPDGSIIKAEGDPKVWLISGGTKRPFANWSSFASRFRPEQIVKVTSADLDNYPLGSEIKFANYSIVQTPDKKIYLLVDNEKRLIASTAVFKKIGFNPEEIEAATIDDLASYAVGKTVTATSTYITGALLQDSKTGEIFYVENGTRALVDKLLLDIKFTGKKIVKKTTKELKVYATTTPILLDEGSLVRTDSFPTIYLISGGKKRPFATDAAFSTLGYNPANVITVTSKFLYNYDMGESIK